MSVFTLRSRGGGTQGGSLARKVSLTSPIFSSLTPGLVIRVLRDEKVCKSCSSSLSKYLQYILVDLGRVPLRRLQPLSGLYASGSCPKMPSLQWTVLRFMPTQSRFVRECLAQGGTREWPEFLPRPTLCIVQVCIVQVPRCPPFIYNFLIHTITAPQNGQWSIWGGAGFGPQVITGAPVRSRAVPLRFEENPPGFRSRPPPFDPRRELAGELLHFFPYFLQRHLLKKSMTTKTRTVAAEDRLEQQTTRLQPNTNRLHTSTQSIQSNAFRRNYPVRFLLPRFAVFPECLTERNSEKHSLSPGDRMCWGSSTADDPENLERRST